MSHPPNGYQHGIPKLQTSVKDALRLAEILAQHYGYDVDLLAEDVTREGLAARFELIRDQIVKSN